MEHRSSPSWLVPAQHQLYTSVRGLVPWSLERVQVYKLPKARRDPEDCPWTHRGCVLRKSDGHILIESEAREQVPFPRLRFSSPIKLGIFFYGYAPEDAPPPAQEADVPPPDPGGEEREAADEVVLVPDSKSKEITFPTLGPGAAPEAVLRAIWRLHINLGHPTRAELTKLICSQGEAKPSTIAAVQALRCESCDRLEKPSRHRQVKLPSAFVGQFGEKVLADFFYLKDLSNNSRLMLGMICDTTLLHGVCRVENRTPEEALRAFRSLWFDVFGLHTVLVLDQDGS